MQLSLTDRVVLVTGGGSGIGEAVAAAVVRAGGSVMLAEAGQPCRFVERQKCCDSHRGCADDQ